MAFPIKHSLNVFDNGDLQVADAPVGRQLYQVKHDFEIPPKYIWRKDAEVNPLIDKHFTEMDEAWQRFFFDLHKSENHNNAFSEAEMVKKFTGSYKFDKAMTNQNGFEDPTDERANYIEGTNLSRPLPKVASIIMGGNILSGREDGEYLWVDYIDGNNSPPSILDVNRRKTPWLIQYGTIAYWTGKVGRFPDMVDEVRGIYYNTPYPVFAMKPVKISLLLLKKLPIGSLIPSPYV